MEWYPLKFEPILKKVIWGGCDICRFKSFHPRESGVGESLELSQLPGLVSVVANGDLKGLSLTQLIERDPVGLLGRSVVDRYGATFPLLIKFIDAASDLSIQVHPDDVLAWDRHRTSGKTEMWYVIDAKPGAKLIAGFSKEIDKEEYERRIEDNTIEEVLRTYDVHVGDVFFLPAGRVHSIGAGIFVAEIQQSSDVTYRLYDYNRTDADGHLRELHTDLAKAAIDFTASDDSQITVSPSDAPTTPLVSCAYFTTNRLALEGATKSCLRDYSDIDSFVVGVCAKGEGILRCGDRVQPFRQGDTLLLPASVSRAEWSTSSELILLETYIL
jgi:mannose-6-phosphate isomerase